MSNYRNRAAVEKQFELFKLDIYRFEQRLLWAKSIGHKKIEAECEEILKTYRKVLSDLEARLAVEVPQSA